MSEPGTPAPDGLAPEQVVIVDRVRAALGVLVEKLPADADLALTFSLERE